jgi:hypothetical protein
MTYQDFFKKYDNKDNSIPLPKDHSQRVGASLAVQVHSMGARPMYSIQNQTVIPETYDKKFDTLFKTRLLNRHPNESDALYNWRLAIYSPVAKELFDRFLNNCLGAIMQPNNYIISVDEKTQEYFNSTYDITEDINEGIEFILNNPRGMMAVVIDSEYDGLKETPISPSIEFIEPCDILMQDKDSIAFKCDEVVYYFDRLTQVTRKGEEYTIINHNFGKVPVWDIDNNFTQPFSYWADKLVSNMSDDEMMTKQYSYPAKQVVVPTCTECNGRGKVTYPDPDYPNDANRWVPSTCKSCSGKGSMSINPGEHYTWTEEKLLKNNGAMPDMVKFSTPDIGIPEYHLGRWQVFYDRAEKALYLNKKVLASQSGIAKQEDNKDQYVFLSTISRFVFANIKKGIEYISAYKNYNQGSDSYDKQDIIVIPPKQLDLMTDADLVTDLLAIQAKTDDSMVLAESQYPVMNKIFRDDKVQSKINDILYTLDPMYGASGLNLKTKMLSGVYTTEDKVIHEKGYNILLNIAKDMTPDAFIKSDNSKIEKDFRALLPKYLPQTIYNAV